MSTVRTPHVDAAERTGLSARASWSLLGPALVVLLLLTLWPIGQAMLSAMYRRSLTVPQGDRFVGVETIGSILSSGVWWRAVAVSVVLIAIAVLLQLVLASAVAAALRRLVLPLCFTVPLLLVPFALLSVVGVTVWHDAFTTGFLPAWFGYDGSSALVSYLAVVAAEVWRGTGITALILLAGLRRVDASLLDSAVAEGADAWQRLRRVTLPAVAPAIAVAVVYRTLDALRMFEGPLLTEDDTRLRTAPLLAWDATFQQFELGLGAALAVLLLLLAVLIGTLLTVGLRVRGPLRGSR